MNWLGIDIGGANLKAADGRGWACSRPFALWKDPAELPTALAKLIGAAPPAERVAVTMTGELCDCFATKADGVRQILTAVEMVAHNLKPLVYLVDGRMAPVAVARELPHLAGASNWHALARFACRFVDHGIGILIDIGSTTADIILLMHGKPCPCGLNDTDRLVAGELVYTGVGRTPICAITSWLPWRGGRCPVASELFATAADAYVTLDSIPEQAEAPYTADGRPLTKQCAQARLARMICADSSQFTAADARLAAEHVRAAQLAELERGMRQVIDQIGQRPNSIVTCGSGEFLARHLANHVAAGETVISLGNCLGADVAASATAHALAVLAAEEFGKDS